MLARRVVLLIIPLALAPTLAAHADEGMWTFDNLPQQQMRTEYHFVPDQAWLEHVQRSAVNLGGCSASFVSDDGLMMTNHHCVESCLQAVGADEKRDVHAEGFQAKTRAEEKSCPGMEGSELLSTTDVTDQVNAATQGLAPAAFQQKLDALTGELEKACVGADTEGTRCNVVDLYHGGQYVLYRYKRFRDLRLVFAPEYAIASFGGDPDNFNFPRFDYDVSFLRAYENGKPAKTPDHLAWSPEPVKDGDEVFVAGNPASTYRLETVAELELDRDVILPATLGAALQTRGEYHEMQRESAHLAQIVDTPLEYLENSVKVETGLLLTLRNASVMQRKRDEEAALRAQVAKDPALAAQIGDPWAAIEAATARRRELFPREEAVSWRSTLYRNAVMLVRAAAERPKASADRLPEFADAALPHLQSVLLSPRPVFPELEQRTLSDGFYRMRGLLGPDDPLVKKVLGKKSPETLSRELVDGTKLADPAVRKAMWEGGAAAIASSDDPMIVFARSIDADTRALHEKLRDEVDGPLDQASEKVAKAWFAMHGKGTYPDATHTLRLAFGRVEGWKREDGVFVPPFTTLGGVFDRATGEDPFALPKSWLDAKSKLPPSMHFNFVTDDDTTGGNSGSPMIDVKGRIIGIEFDGNIDAIGADYAFDDVMDRTVGVSAEAILEGIRTVYHDDALAAEITGKRSPEN